MINVGALIWLGYRGERELPSLKMSSVSRRNWNKCPAAWASDASNNHYAIIASNRRSR